MTFNEEIIVGLDVGTSKVCALVAERDENNDPRVVAVGDHPSRGLRKGEVVDMAATVESIEKAVSAAEELCGRRINSVYAGITGSHIESFISRAAVPVAKPAAGVTRKDIDRAIDSARSVAIPRQKEVVHNIVQDFALDEKRGIANPLGMTGSRLEVQVNIVTGAVTAIRDVVNSINQAGLEVEDIVLQQLASSLAVLRKEEQESGVVLLDIGGGTTDYVFFRDNIIRHIKVISVGGYHITNDITLGLNLLARQAEELKKKCGTVAPSDGDNDIFLHLPPGLVRPPGRNVTRRLTRIIECRMEELFRLIGKDLVEEGHFQNIGSGLVLTGGGSLLRGTAELASRVTGLPVRRGIAHGVTGLREVIESPIYATAVGLVKYGFQSRTDEAGHRRGRRSPIGRKFLRLKNWLERYF